MPPNIYKIEVTEAEKKILEKIRKQTSNPDYYGGLEIKTRGGKVYGTREWRDDRF